MNIVIVCGKLNHGGAERVAATLANGFSRISQDNVTVMSNLNEEITYEIDERVELCNLISREDNRLIKWIAVERNLRRYLKKRRPDVIIGIMQLCSLVSVIASRRMRIPVIMTEHGPFEQPIITPLSKIEYFCKFYLNKIYQYITVLTTRDKQIIGNRLKNVVVMPNPLAIDRVVGKVVKKKVVFACGRLYDWHCKGFDVLLEAWGRCCQMGQSEKNAMRKDFTEGWCLQIAGVGSEQDLNILREIARKNGVEDRTSFLGFRKDIEELYRQSEIFVLSSRYEGFGLVLIEAMSQGCACIACDYNGRQKEIFGSECCGEICTPDDPVVLSEALELLLINEQYRHELQQKAITRAEYYSIEHTVERWKEYLADILKEKTETT